MKNLTELFGRESDFLSQPIHLEALPPALSEMDFGRNLAITALVATFTSLVGRDPGLTGSVCGGAAALRRQRLLLNTILIVYLFPAVLLIIPLFAMLVQIGDRLQI